MPSVHLVFHGSYDEQRVVGVYSDPSRAKRMQALEDPCNEIQSFELDPPLPDWLPENHTLWHASVTLVERVPVVPLQAIYVLCVGFHEGSSEPTSAIFEFAADYVARGAFRLGVTLIASDEKAAAALACALFEEHLGKTP
jgi:hypothetical protein